VALTTQLNLVPRLKKEQNYSLSGLSWSVGRSTINSSSPSTVLDYSLQSIDLNVNIIYKIMSVKLYTLYIL